MPASSGIAHSAGTSRRSRAVSATAWAIVRGWFGLTGFPSGIIFRVHGGRDRILRRATVGHGRTASRASLAGWGSGVGLVLIVAALTFATRAHELPLRPFVASAARIALGQVWVVPSSALIVDRPVLIGLAAFGLLAAATLRVCGARTFWLTAAMGHAGSTLLVYGIIGSTRLADPHMFTRAVVTPDFGVSAMQGAWVGAITATAWSRAGTDHDTAPSSPPPSARSRSRWSLHPDPSILTTEHLFAFLIGCGIVSWRPLAAAGTEASRRLVRQRRNAAQHA